MDLPQIKRFRHRQVCGYERSSGRVCLPAYGLSLPRKMLGAYWRRAYQGEKLKPIYSWIYLIGWDLASYIFFLLFCVIFFYLSATWAPIMPEYQCIWIFCMRVGGRVRRVFFQCVIERLALNLLFSCNCSFGKNRENLKKKKNSNLSCAAVAAILLVELVGVVSWKVEQNLKKSWQFLFIFQMCFV